MQKKKKKALKLRVLRVTRVYSQVGDAGFAHRAGDGLHGRAQRVEQGRQLPCALRLPALLHDEPGHGDHVGVEGASVGHGGRGSPTAREWKSEEMLQNLNAQQRGTWVEEWECEDQSGSAGSLSPPALETLLALCKLNRAVMKW